jgi:hypothetical protein
MANNQVSEDGREYATVDTDPTSGYFTKSVSPRHLKEDIFFSIRETDPDASLPSEITIVLQFQCHGDTGWQTFNYNDGTALVAGDRFHIDDYGAGVYWRAGVEAGEYVSGSLTFGFDW